MTKGEMVDEVKVYWDSYRELGIEPSTSIYEEFEDTLKDYWDRGGWTLEERAYYEFREVWVCPYCGRDPNARRAAGAQNVTRFRTRFSGSSTYVMDGYRELRMHLALYHSDQNKLQVDRSQTEFWNYVRDYVNKNEQKSHEIWTRELQKIWVAISEL
jgi:hypothetical protein